jgi:FBP C-terminal treble-clef zinc-finger
MGRQEETTMFRIETEKDLMQAFRPRDRKTLELPAGFQFPLFVRDYLAWTEPAGTRVFLVVPSQGSRLPVGIAFRRDSQGGGPASCMCDWCHSYGSADEIGLLTTDVNSKRRVGVSLCIDLRCKEKLEAVADRSGRHPLELMKPLMERMSRFAREALRIQTVPED